MGFSTFKLTDVGAALLAQAVASGDITFTNGAVGKGYLAASSNETGRTALIDHVCDLSVSSATVNTGAINVKLQFSNADDDGFITGFNLAEIGLFGKIGSTGTETLIAYANARDSAHADFIPGDSLREFTFTFNLRFTGAEDVDVTVGSSIVYATAADVNGKADKPSNPTASNFAALDANGNLTDSGKSAGSFGTAQRIELSRFTASGTFNPADYPTTDGKYDVFIVGGGQGGAWKSSRGIAYGGAGGKGRLLTDLTLTDSVTCTIGAGSSSNGNNGGTTSFGTYNAPGGGASEESVVTYTSHNPYDGRDYGGQGGRMVIVHSEVSSYSCYFSIGLTGGNGGYSAVGAGGNGGISWDTDDVSNARGGNGGISGGGGGASSGLNTSSGSSGLIIIYDSPIPEVQ